MPTGKQRRSKRDPESSRRLDEVQNVMKTRREAAKRRETATIDAVQTYLHAAGAIRQRTGIHDQRVGELRKRIEQLEREYEAEVTRWRGRQAGAVAAMRTLGESDDDIGELLELTTKQVRQLISVARASERPANEPDPSGRALRPDPVQEPEPAGAHSQSKAVLNTGEPVGQSLA
ncbi:hypothetical protein [Nocardia ignorata]|uniref:Uncharacterized protein n=1 Tax=Nocardia ignorata TaxID=145285 RepID=A0A4R6NY96_NOCIG|nr:hypothetical protein [Nocardia ignorata]TDP27733.1 hypothetical protein DFR75_1225 [Nocardia ignorata]